MARVQTTGEQTTGGANPTCTFPGNPTAGNLIVVTIHNTGSTSVTAISDGTNTYQRAVGQTNVNNRVDIWYAYNIASGGSALTLTITQGAVTRKFEAVEYDNTVSASNPFDQSSSGTGTAGTTDPGSITNTSTDGNLTIAAATSVAAITFADPPTGFTSSFLDATTFGAVSDYKIDTGANTLHPTWTGATNRWSAAVASFKQLAIVSAPSATAASTLPKLSSSATGTQYVTSGSPIGPTYFDAWTNNSAVGTSDWQNPGNADSNSATFALSQNTAGNTTHYLRGVPPSLTPAIKPGYAITGIVVEVECDVNGGAGELLEARLVRGGTADTSSTKSQTATTTKQFLTFGGTTDTWGGGITAAEVNANDFGIVLFNTNVTSWNIEVYRARVTFYFAAPPVATAASTLPKLGSAAVGVMPPKAAASSTVPKLTSAGVAAQLLKATAASSLPKLTSAATGVQVHKATAASSLPKLTSAALVVQILKATGASAVPKLTSAAVAKQILSGAATSTLPKLTSSAVAYLQPRAVGASTLPKLRSLGAVFIPTAGGGASRLPMLTSAGIGYRYPGYSGPLPVGSVAVAVVGPSGTVTVAQVGPSGAISIGNIVGPGGTASITQGAGGSVSLSLTGPGGSVQAN